MSKVSEICVDSDGVLSVRRSENGTFLNFNGKLCASGEEFVFPSGMRLGVDSDGRVYSQECREAQKRFLPQSVTEVHIYGKTVVSVVDERNDLGAIAAVLSLFPGSPTVYVGQDISRQPGEGQRVLSLRCQAFETSCKLIVRDEKDNSITILAFYILPGKVINPVAFFLDLVSELANYEGLRVGEKEKNVSDFIAALKGSYCSLEVLKLDMFFGRDSVIFIQDDRIRVSTYDACSGQSAFTFHIGPDAQICFTSKNTVPFWQNVIAALYRVHGRKLFETLLSEYESEGKEDFLDLAGAIWDWRNGNGLPLREFILGRFKLFVLHSCYEAGFTRVPLLLPSAFMGLLKNIPSLIMKTCLKIFAVTRLHSAKFEPI